jgi:GH35 family endo-1,4-beta-xylanase
MFVAPGWGVGSKFDVIYHMLKNFSSRTPPVPIDGVGLQMHCDVGSWGGNSAAFAKNLSANIHNLTTTFKGVEFRVTEMDVTCGGYR